MRTEDTLLGTVSRTMVRTVAGFLVAGVLGLVGVVAALGPGAWDAVAAGDWTGWELERADQVDEAERRAARRERQVGRLLAERDCSAHGFGDEAVPASAVVQVRGRVQVVSFDEGWAVYRDEAPGRLLAVCRR